MQCLGCGYDGGVKCRDPICETQAHGGRRDKMSLLFASARVKGMERG